MAKFNSNILVGLVLVVITTVSSTACAGSNKHDVLATVGNNEITVRDLEERINKFPPQQKVMYESAENRGNLLKEMIRLKVFAREARANGWHEGTAFKARVTAAENALLAMDYIKKNVLKIDVSQQEIEKFYKENSASFIAPESIRLSSVYIDAVRDACPNDVADKKVVAKKIQQSLKKGGDFSSVKEKYGKLAKVEDNSDYFARGRLIPELEQAAFSLKVGEVSPLLETEKGFAIFRMEDKKSARPLSFAEVEDKIRGKLKEFKVKAKYKEIETRLFAKYKVNVKSERDITINTATEVSHLQQGGL